MTLDCKHQFCSDCVKEFTAPREIEYDYGDSQHAFTVNLSQACPICRGEVSNIDKNTAKWKNFQKKGGGGSGGKGGGRSKVQ